MSDKYTDRDIIYAATARCQCGSGVAYPLDHAAALKSGAWTCARKLRGEVEGDVFPHDVLPFIFWKVREETSINNHGGHTTRPSGTVARTQGRATCPKCNHQWESTPYDACGASHHWFSGPCPNCGHAVGGGASYSSADGPAIDSRYSTVVLSVTDPAPPMTDGAAP